MGRRAARRRARAARDRAVLLEAEEQVAREQDAVIQRALHEDAGRAHEDLQEVAENEAEASPWGKGHKEP